MKLQEIFSKDNWKLCLEKIKERDFFEMSFIRKPYKFRFSFRECKNGLWKDDLMTAIDVEYKTCGYSYPMQLDELPKEYDEFCAGVNKFWAEQEEFDKDKEVLKGQLSLFD